MGTYVCMILSDYTNRLGKQKYVINILHSEVQERKKETGAKQAMDMISVRRVREHPRRTFISSCKTNQLKPGSSS